MNLESAVRGLLAERKTGDAFRRPARDVAMVGDRWPEKAEARQLLRVIVIDDEPLAIRRLRYILEQVPDVELVGSAPSCNEALAAIERKRPDAILLDIKLGDGSGFDLLDQLPAERRPAVILVTAFDQFAPKAFEAQVVDYLLKPVEVSRLSLALERARYLLEIQAQSDRMQEMDGLISSLRDELRRNVPCRFEQQFWIRTQGGSYLSVSAIHIDWAIADDDYVKIRSSGRELLMRETLRGLYSRLDPKLFVRIHRSALVRIAAVKEFKRCPVRGNLEALMLDGRSLPVGRVYAKSLRRFLTAS